VQPASGLGEVAQVGDGDEGLYLSDIHGSGIQVVTQRTMHFTIDSVTAMLGRPDFA
jgi:hypothetical protein